MLVEIDAKTILGLLLFVPLYGIWLKLGACEHVSRKKPQDEYSLPGSLTFPATASTPSTKKRKNKKKGKGNDKTPGSSFAPEKVVPSKTDEDFVPNPPSRVEETVRSNDAKEAWFSPPPASLTASTGTTVTTNRKNHKKKSKGAELSNVEFPPLTTATKSADTVPEQRSRISETSDDGRRGSEPVSKGGGPEGGIRHPKDREIDDDESTPVRVIKVVSEPEYTAESEDAEERRKDVEDGWVKIPTAPGPRTLRITSSRSTTTPRLKPSSFSATSQVEETKKQRENRRKAERRREQKEAERLVQEERMRQHKRTMVNVRMAELAKEDAARRRISASTRMDDLLFD